MVFGVLQHAQDGRECSPPFIRVTTALKEPYCTSATKMIRRCLKTRPELESEPAY